MEGKEIRETLFRLYLGILALFIIFIPWILAKTDGVQGYIMMIFRINLEVLFDQTYRFWK